MYETLYTVANIAVLPAWLMLGFAPGHPVTHKLVRSGLYSLAYCVAYVALFVMLVGTGRAGSMARLADIQGAFQIPAFALLGWVHYIAFDLLAGVKVREEADVLGKSRLFMAPFLFMTLLLGPLGFLLWRTARAFGKRG
jgi:hypothetical protein